MDEYDLVSLDHMATGWMGVQEPGPHVLRVHAASRCADDPACCIHKPSDHHMRTWKMNWRDDSKVMERLCPHGIGHPDPDATAWAESHGIRWYGVHGCDGCCQITPHPEFPCATDGCPGDGRYAPPGRGHRAGCTGPVSPNGGDAA